MMKFIPLIFVFTLVLSSCGSDEYPYEYGNISEFRMKKDALKDNEEIKLIYFSNGPLQGDLTEEQDFYYHVVAVSQETGDTVNILTAVNNGFTENDGDKIYNFSDEDNVGTKVLTMTDGMNMSTEELNRELKKPVKRYSKVVRDPKFDDIGKNSYPTVIGSIGKSTENYKSEEMHQ